jgi:hypothetical protein
MIAQAGAFDLGQQGIGSNYAIAIDPSDATAKTVYVAYVLVNTGQPEIHVAKSTQGGKAGSWSQVLQTPIANAALPSLAVTTNGTLGVRYTRLTNQMMSTEFLQVPKQGAAGPASVLTSWPQNNPVKDPNRTTYIGDFQQLVAVGNVFYGAFSASNQLVMTQFPKGVFYQRSFNTDGTVRNNDYPFKYGKMGNTVDGTGNVVAVSIDPFFFRTSAGQ